jgi:hypothetical protein
MEERVHGKDDVLRWAGVWDLLRGADGFGISRLETGLHLGVNVGNMDIRC